MASASAAGAAAGAAGGGGDAVAGGSWPEGGGVDAVMAWRQERLAALTTDDGWLTLVGLVWLSDGDNAVGGDAARCGATALGDAAFGAPPLLGVVRVQPPSAGRGRCGNGGGQAPQHTVTLVVDAAALAGTSVDGAPVAAEATYRLLTDATPTPSVVRFGDGGDLSFFVIVRDGRCALRVKHRRARTLTAFAGLRYFEPPSPRFCVRATFERYRDAPRAFEMPNALGGTDAEQSYGQLVFKIDGMTHTLQTTGDPATQKQFFIVFADATTRHETYGGGRFVYCHTPRAGGDGSVLLDFNRAYTPPCAFTPYATCPRPATANRLTTVRIEAGELKPDDGGGQAH